MPDLIDALEAIKRYELSRSEYVAWFVAEIKEEAGSAWDAARTLADSRKLLTKQQKYHRRLARKYGNAAKLFSQWLQPGWEQSDLNHVRQLARQAAQHAFMAHPELRD